MQLMRGTGYEPGIGAVLAAVYDPATDTFKSVSKVGTGFTEDELVKLKSMLDEVALEQRHPRVVWAFGGFQKGELTWKIL